MSLSLIIPVYNEIDQLDYTIKKLMSLKKKIKNIDFSDPYIKSFIKTRTSKIDKKSVKISPKILRKYDLTILMTDHDNFDYKVIYKNSNFIIDTRGKFQLDNKVIRG